MNQNMKMKTMICYRGSLKSCNYSCAYCPFSKRKTSQKELQQDSKDLFRFVDSIKRTYLQVEAVQIVPYGEALIHGYYWEALGRLTSLRTVQAAGAQTNASFDVVNKLKIFDKAGGDREKLRLWVTFHPSMTSVEDFVAQCRLLYEEGILYCVGAVGISDNLPVIRKLRHMLPDRIYMWINKLDTTKMGTRHLPDKKETEEFLKLDPYYTLECAHHPAMPHFCEKFAFVEADGSVKGCNLSRHVLGNWYEGELKETTCNQKECSCYLAYCHQEDSMQLKDFAPYPMFRIPS